MDDDERQALRDEGLNPDDPAVIAAIDVVRWELSLALESPHPPDGSPPSFLPVVGTKVITRRLPVRMLLSVATGQVGRTISAHGRR